MIKHRPHGIRTSLLHWLLPLWLVGICGSAVATERQTINALYMPLADHYAAIVAYERYREQMQHADFRIKQMGNWNLLRAYFRSEKADMAYVMAPLAMAMFDDKNDFRWIGQAHRNGSALVINHRLNARVQVSGPRANRLPNTRLAEALHQSKDPRSGAINIGVPHLLSTHSVALYQYLKHHQLSFNLHPGMDSDVQFIAVSPLQSLTYLKQNNQRAIAAAVEQSLPWPDMAEDSGTGKLAWYSRDVLPWPDGHVGCLVIAKDKALAHKYQAVDEVMHYIQRAASDIETARREGGTALENIVDMIRKHIRAHPRQAIINSLTLDLDAISYRQLGIESKGLKYLMDIAVEAGILEQAIDLKQFIDPRFTPDKKASEGEQDD